jgi:thymidylate synthase
MHLTTRNVNTAFRELVAVFDRGARAANGRTHATNADNTYSWGNVVRRPSRNGDVLMIDEPVTVTYTHPRERVLFNAARDANPFFHLYEALWMLAGRNDAAPVAYYAKQMAEYSDDGETLNGAYGRRWRKASTVYDAPAEARYGQSTCVVDQLNVIVNHLKADPTSRRAVLQMWNVEDDLLKIGGRSQCVICKGSRLMVHGTERDPGPDSPLTKSKCVTCSGRGWTDWSASKDVCCNLSVMFSLREGTEPSRTKSSVHPELGPLPIADTFLDMTVTNRSNDLVWGMLGANYVHFTFLQEYMAARLGVEVGRYHHFTNNLHAYSWNWKPDEWLAPPTVVDNYIYGPDAYSPLQTVPLVRDPEAFERELPLVVETCWGYPGRNEELPPTLSEPFLQDVAVPAFGAFANHKAGDYALAAEVARQIKADDWRLACAAWLERRRK